MTPSQAAKLVAVLLQAYPQAQFGPSSSALYERELADLDAGTALDAVRRIVRTNKWLPTVAEIRAAAVDVTAGARRLGVEAWGDVVEAIRRIGSYQAAPEFTDQATSECVRLLGWLNLCRGTNEAADRARFVELYDGLSGRQRADLVAGKALPAAAPVGALPWRTGGLRALPAAPVALGLTESQARELEALDELDEQRKAAQ